MAEARDYYEILQVHPSADPEVIQAAYRRLSLKYHPDVNKSKAAEVRMRELNAAYEVLSDPEKRAAYDMTKSRPRALRDAPPILHVDPTEVDLGVVASGRAKTAHIRLSNDGGGTLTGFVVSHVPWLKVSPPNFEANDLDAILRFQASLPGLYQSSRAAEVYSNGGRISLPVRATVTAIRGGIGSPFTQEVDMAWARTRPKGARPAFRGPSVSWLLIMAALISGLVWYLINPWLVVVPVPIGVWLAWHKISREGGLPLLSQGSRSGRRPLATRCLVCGATIGSGRSVKCSRCGGNICPACGACGCNSGGVSKRPA